MTPQLEPRLAKIRAWVEENVPAPVKAVMENHIQLLRNTKAVDLAVKVGQKAPAFTLKNQRGEELQIFTGKVLSFRRTALAAEESQ